MERRERPAAKLGNSIIIGALTMFCEVKAFTFGLFARAKAQS
jgi:hypothetical protein